MARRDPDSSMELPDFDGGPDLMNAFLQEACNVPGLSHLFADNLETIDLTNDDITDPTDEASGIYTIKCLQYIDMQLWPSEEVNIQKCQPD